MKTIQALTDKFAVGLSLVCAAHCLLFPVLVALLPSLAVLGLESESFHFWMVVLVIPTSIYALTLGCKNHKNYRLLILGAVGVGFLISALVFGEMYGEMAEKILTLTGAALIAVGHLLNYRLCRESKTSEAACACS